MLAAKQSMTQRESEQFRTAIADNSSQQCYQCRKDQALMTITVTQKAFSFKIDDYKVDHQGGAILDIGVNLKYRKKAGDKDPQDYLEFQQIINYIDNYLTTYPNETDYWEVLNKNMSTSLMTDKIPTIWGFDYQLSKSIKKITVDIHVQPGSGDVAYSRSSTVSVRSNPGDPASDPKDRNSNTLTTLLGILADEGRIRARKNNRFQLALTGLGHIEWLTDNQKLQHQSWDIKKIAKQWNKIFNEDTFALASFKSETEKKMAFFDIDTTKPGKHSNSLIINIQGLRHFDQDLLTGLNKEEINDISLSIGDSIPSTKGLIEAYTNAEIDNSPSKRIMANNDVGMSPFDQDNDQLIRANDHVHSPECLL